MMKEECLATGSENWSHLAHVEALFLPCASKQHSDCAQKALL